jgi:hypothetical protein
MSMSRKYYVAIASLLASLRSDDTSVNDTLDRVASGLAGIFAADNSRASASSTYGFSPDRFLAASGVDSELYS